MFRSALCFACLLLSLPARATGPRTFDLSEDLSYEALVSDLTSEERRDRLFAGRELRHQVANALADSQRGNGTTLWAAEAMVVLDEFDRTLAPRCIEALTYSHVAGNCAVILRMLETHEALEPLRQAAVSPTHSRRAKRIIQRSLRILQASLDTADTGSPGLVPSEPSAESAPMKTEEPR